MSSKGDEIAAREYCLHSGLDPDKMVSGVTRSDESDAPLRPLWIHVSKYLQVIGRCMHKLETLDRYKD